MNSVDTLGDDEDPSRSAVRKTAEHRLSPTRRHLSMAPHALSIPIIAGFIHWRAGLGKFLKDYMRPLSRCILTQDRMFSRFNFY
jgi:hypothetical protein